MDSLPRAARRRGSNEIPAALNVALQDIIPVDSSPRKVSRQPSGGPETKLIPSIRKPRRLPTPSNSQSTAGVTSRKKRSKSLFSFSRSKSFRTKSNSRLGGDTCKAVVHHHGHHNDGHNYNHRHNNNRSIVGHRGASSGELGTECTTDRDTTDADYLVTNLPADLAAKMDLRNDNNEEDAKSQGSSGSQKDRRPSLPFHQIFRRSSRFHHMGQSGKLGTGSRYHCSKSSSGSNNSSLLSSLSSSFSSWRSRRFIFHTTNSDRRLAELDGHSLPAFTGTSGHEPDGRPVDCNNDESPPKLPTRRSSLESHSTNSFSRGGSSSLSSHRLVDGYSYNPSSSSPESNGGGSRVMDGGALPRRRNSISTPIAAIAEVENEVDLSVQFTVDDMEAAIKPSSFQRASTLESISLFGAVAESLQEEKGDEMLNRSAPVHKVGLSEEIQQELNQARRNRRKSAPARPIPRGSNSSIPSSEELPFPVRRESIQSYASTGASQKSRESSRRRRNSKVPTSVPPEATVMEKKSFLRRTLHFPKQKLESVLRRVSTTGTAVRTKASSTAPAQESADAFN